MEEVQLRVNEDLAETTPSLCATPRIVTDALAERGSGEHVPMAGFEAMLGATVMIVDDDAVVIDVVQTFLQEAGCTHFLRTTDPARAVAMMREHQPDLVLMDLSMPLVSGFDILADLKRYKELRHIPVIILTAGNDPQSKLRALELGATDFLTKPVDSSELQLRVRNTLAFRAYQKRLVDIDGLTGLLNRRKLRQKLDEFLAAAARAGTQCVLAHIDLDRFKRVNDTLGYHAGDRMLREAGARMEEMSNNLGVKVSGVPGDGWSRVLLGRVSGNGFAIMISGLSGAAAIQQAVHLAQRIREVFVAPFQTLEQDDFVTVSTGLAVFPEDGADADEMLSNAEKAMYQAKQRGRNNYEFVSGNMNAHASESVKLESELRRAIERNQLHLYYQPRVEIASNRIVGVEALARWRHPELGMLLPGKFIPLAEETGLIIDIGRWVLREACTQVRGWTDQGLAPIEVSVNVSAPQLRDQQVRKDVEAALAFSGLDPSQLVVELTESMLMEEAEDSVAMLCELTAMGLKLSMDDFGTGYSSLAYLTRFPLSEIKIDRFFVHRVAQDQKNRAIVSTIITMGRELGITTIAEGVETPEQLAFLKSRACDQYQGYLFSRPVPVSQVVALLRRNASRQT